MRYPWRGLELLLKDVEWVQVAWAGADSFGVHLLEVRKGALTLFATRVSVKGDITVWIWNDVVPVECS